MTVATCMSYLDVVKSHAGVAQHLRRVVSLPDVKHRTVFVYNSPSCVHSGKSPPAALWRKLCSGGRNRGTRLRVNALIRQRDWNQLISMHGFLRCGEIMQWMVVVLKEPTFVASFVQLSALI